MTAQLDDIGAWLDTRNESFELGYRLGYASGYDIGRGSVYYEIHQASLTHRFKFGPLDVPQTELLQRRAEIGEACQEFAKRHGGPYRGGPVDWDTGQPLRGAA